MPPREWPMAKAQFAVPFAERFIKAMAAKCSTVRRRANTSALRC